VNFYNGIITRYEGHNFCVASKGDSPLSVRGSWEWLKGMLSRVWMWIHLACPKLLPFTITIVIENESFTAEFNSGAWDMANGVFCLPPCQVNVDVVLGMGMEMEMEMGSTDTDGSRNRNRNRDVSPAAAASRLVMGELGIRIPLFGR